MEETGIQTDLTNCRNCGAPLRGEYCHHCGQREGRGDLQFAEAAGDILGDLFTWDSRFWRTLVPLIFRPGFLTAEFIAGRRARYVPPFRLYIIISFVMFLVLAVLARDIDGFDEDGDGINVNITSEQTADPNDIAEAQEAIAEAQAQLDGLGIPVDLSEHTDAALAADGPTVIAPVAVSDDDSDSVNIGLSDPNSPQWMKDLEERLETNGERLRDNPDLFIEMMLDYLPQMMFLMLPVFALLLRLCYLLSPFHYLQHLVFGLHYHSFVYLLYLISEGLERLGSEVVGWLWLALVIYMPLALRRAYHSGVGAAIFKTLFIYVSYGVSLLAAFAAVVVLAVALM